MVIDQKKGIDHFSKVCSLFDHYFGKKRESTPKKGNRLQIKGIDTKPAPKKGNRRQKRRTLEKKW